MKRKADVDLTEEESSLKKRDILFEQTKVWVHYHHHRTGRFPLYHLTFNEPWTFCYQSASPNFVNSFCRCLYVSQTPYGAQWTSFQIPTYDKCWLAMYEPEAFRRAAHSHLEWHFRGSAAVTNLVLQYILPLTTTITVPDDLIRLRAASFEVKLSPANLHENDVKKFWPKGQPISIHARQNSERKEFINYAIWCLDETAMEFKKANKHRLNLGPIPEQIQLYYNGTPIPDTTTLRGLGADITADCCTIHMSCI